MFRGAIKSHRCYGLGLFSMNQILYLFPKVSFSPLYGFFFLPWSPTVYVGLWVQNNGKWEKVNGHLIFTIFLLGHVALGKWEKMLDDYDMIRFFPFFFFSALGSGCNCLMLTLDSFPAFPDMHLSCWSCFFQVLIHNL